MDGKNRRLELSNLPTGDVPGDRVIVTDDHRAIAGVLHGAVGPLLASARAGNPFGRAVLSVYGGSGVGKSEVGALLVAWLRGQGVSTYLLSGDNYPNRIPADNDAERWRIFRHAGQQSLDEAGLPTSAAAQLAVLSGDGRDADPAACIEYPWLATYQQAGREALSRYLGSDAEIDFSELNTNLGAFREGAAELRLKRMGRKPGELWHDVVAAPEVLVVEWTHGNSPHLRGVDVPIFLASTPAQTLAHRQARGRDQGVDSAFTTMVLELEQEQLSAVVSTAAVIVGHDRRLIDAATYRESLRPTGYPRGPILNCYPDSLGGTAKDVADFLDRPEVRPAFDSVYLLPTVFHSDLDRGFSVIDYDLNADLVQVNDLRRITSNRQLMLDVVLNHASVRSPQFQDLLGRGDQSPWASFFVDWNQFWAGHGELTVDGYIQPDPALLSEMFFRKPGLPLLMVEFADGSKRPYWNTFYQEVSCDPATGRLQYQGQVDLNIADAKVWDFYAETLTKLADYGATVVRLDAFAYAAKSPGRANFLNQPQTWDLLERLRNLAAELGMTVLPELHASYAHGFGKQLSERGFLGYDFFTPGLIIDAVERHDASVLAGWAREQRDAPQPMITMLGCHDGIPVLDLDGLLDSDQIEALVRLIVARGGLVKDLHGATDIYYQVNATYLSALGESTAKLLLARAIQVFLPGIPQVWYLDLFGGSNDNAAVHRSGGAGHKEINRTNLSAETVAAGLGTSLVQDQLALLRLRRLHPAFGPEAVCQVDGSDGLQISWTRGEASATLRVELATSSFAISAVDDGGHSLEWVGQAESGS